MQLSKQERFILNTLAEEITTADEKTLLLIAKILKDMANDE